MADVQAMWSMNKIKVLFFATLRDRAGTKSVELDVPADMTVQALKEKLAGDYPNLKESMKAVWFRSIRNMH